MLRLLITYWEEHWWFLIYRKVPESNIDGHGAEEQAHATGDPLCTCERTAWGRIHYGHPDVFVPEAGRSSALEDISEGDKSRDRLIVPITTSASDVK